MDARVRDFQSRPVYGVGERWGSLSARRAGGSRLLLRGLFGGCAKKYVIRDFDLLVFFYAFGFLSTSGGRVGTSRSLIVSGRNGGQRGTSCSSWLSLISAWQSTLFAMWFDMESNKDLR